MLVILQVFTLGYLLLIDIVGNYIDGVLESSILLLIEAMRK